MRKKEINKRLNQIVSDNVPDVLDNILAQCDKREGIEVMKQNNEVKKEKVVEKKKLKINFLNYKLAGALAAFVICLFGVLGFNQYHKVTTTVDSIIDFDVNPSVEIKTNAQEKIIEANALNDDGKKILEGMDLEKVDLDVGVNAIVGSMLKNGYITEIQNSILVSVKNDDEQKAKDLETRLSNEINEYLNSQNIQGAVLAQMYGDDDAIEKLAYENNISEGKANLINKVLATGLKDAKGNAYTFENLSKLSINELNVLLNSKNVELAEVSSTGNSNKSAYIGEEKAKEIAFKKAGVSSKNAKNVQVELDSENGVLYYEVDFDAGKNEYEYEINATDGKIITSSVERNDDYNKKSNTSSSKTANVKDDDDDDYDDRYDRDDDNDIDDKYDDDDDDKDDRDDNDNDDDDDDDDDDDGNTDYDD